MWNLVYIAIQNQWQNRRRTLTLGAVIVLSTLVVVLIGGVHRGIRESMVRSTNISASGQVNVGGVFKLNTGHILPAITNAAKVEKFVRKVVPTAEIVGRVRGIASIYSEAGAVLLFASGVDVKTDRRFVDHIRVVRGDVRHLERRNGLLLFDVHAKKLGVSIGDKVTVSSPAVRGTGNAMDMTVVAIAKSIGLLNRWRTYMSSKSMRRLMLLNHKTTGALQLYLKDPEQADAVAKRLRAALARGGFKMLPAIGSRPFPVKLALARQQPWFGQRLDVSTWEDELSAVTWSLTVSKVIGTMFIAILLAIIVVGLMNSQWLTIRERTREFGALRAIGMRPSHLLFMLTVEAGVLSLVACVVGAVLAVGAAALLNAAKIGLPPAIELLVMSDTLLVQLSPELVIGTAAIITLALVAFSIVPASKGARVSPVVAMRDV